MHTSKILAATSVLAFAVVANAVDLTVEQGADPVTISESATYGTVIVNGDLTVAPGVTLTCTNLTVANNIDGTATLTIGDGATIVVHGEGATKIGVGIGRAEIYLGTGAYFDAHSGYFNFCYGYESAPDSSAAMTEALLVVGTNATVRCDEDFCFGHVGNNNKNKPSSVDYTVVKAIVRLDEGAVISAQRIIDISPVSEIIQFNGGSIVQRTSSDYTGGFFHMQYAAKKSYLYLDGTNGCPITLDLPGVGKHSSLAGYGSAECRLVMRGDGGFLKTGASVFPLVDPSKPWQQNANLRFLFTGDFVIEEGGFSVATKPTNNVFMAANDGISRPVDMVVKSGAKFDLAGCDVVLNSIEALGGVVTNSAATNAKLTVGVLNDGVDSTIAQVIPGIDVVKKGESTLTLRGADSDLASLDLQAGTLAFKDTARLGYKFYRFQVDGHKAGFGTNSRMYMKELAFMLGGEDVTRPYADLHYDLSGTAYVNSPENMLDGDLETEYYDLRACFDDARLANVGVTVEYADCQPVDSYRWAPHNSSSSSADPTAWRVFGGYTKDDLTLLDQVTDFTVTDVASGWNATNFVCSYGSSALHIGTLKLGNGSKVGVAGAQISCDTFTAAASGLELDLANGAMFPLTAEQSVSKISVAPEKGIATVSVLNPESSGAIYVIGGLQVLKGDLLYAGSCANAGNLADWSIYHNGALLANRRLCFKKGAVRLMPPGMIVIVR